MNVGEIEIKDFPDPQEIPFNGEFPRVEMPNSYREFFEDFLMTNRPCIVSDFISSEWKSRNLWVRGNKVDWQYLQELVGDAEVPVANCKEREYNAQKKTTFRFRDFISYFKKYVEGGYPATESSLYLKDWHLTRDFPSLDAYKVPKYFASDWLNEYFSSRTDVNDDYRFVYIGPKGTWTPLHADVFTSFSWSVNVVGQKRWLLFPPGQENHLRDRFGNLAYDATSEEVLDKSRFPKHDHLHSQYDVIQEAGEAIFVPSGWHHQVWNLEDCISINHNWVNGCNIRQMWISLRDNLSAVQKEVSDCRDMDDWESHCQLILKASYGLDCKEFFDMLSCIARPRIAQLTGQKPVLLYGGWQLGNNHAAWDLRQVLAALILLKSDQDIQCLPWVQDAQFDDIIQEIQGLLLKRSA